MSPLLAFIAETPKDFAMTSTSDARHSIRRLAAQLPPGAVSWREADCLAASMDLWPRHLVRIYRGKLPSLPVGVVWPESVEAVQRIVGFARDVGLGVVPYGAGSSVVGGASASAEHLVLDLKRLGRVLRVDESAHTVTAQTGILGERLERHLQRLGFTQGHFPSSIYCSTLGGWLAARSAGQMSSLYGKIEDQVLGGVAVMGDGSLLHQAPSVLRDARFEALIGSEGTLGVLTEATLRIHPLPAQRWWRGLDFPTLKQALAAAQHWLQAGLAPSVARIYDPLDTFLHRGTHGKAEPHDRGPSFSAALGAYLPRLVGFLGDHVGGRCRTIVGLEGAAGLVACDAEALLAIARQHGAVDCGPGPGESWYARRYAVSYRLSNAFRAGVAADTMEVACLWDRVLPVYQAVKHAGLEAGAQVLAHFSHMYREGASIYFTFALPASGGEEAYGALWDACLSAAVGAGANVSHHHGVGQLKAAVMHAAQGDGGAVLDALRTRHDPARILNPDTLASGAHPARVASLVPHGKGELPAALVPLPANESVSSAESRLQKSGQTLGPVAGLWPALTLVEAARRRLLWRRNGQFATVEPLVAGVDTDTFRFLPAPRAAQGPDLVDDLLHGAVGRLWVRCGELASRHLRARGSLASCLRLARDLAVHPVGHIVAIGVQSADGALVTAGKQSAADGGTLIVELPADQGRQALALNALHEVTGTTSYDLQAEPFQWPPLPVDDVLLVGGLWATLHPFLAMASAAGASVHLPWIDKAGATGMLAGPPELLASLRTQATAAGLVGEAQSHAAPATALGTHDAVPLHDPAALRDPAQHRPLGLREHAAALDNCTYCPKLCRFACPVAVAQGTETWTPRQLMLTANLDRTERQALHPDVAAQLWACVDCRGCRSFCDHDNDVATVLQAARGELWERGVAPPAVTYVLDGMIRHGALPGSNAERTIVADGPEAPTWLWLSCQNDVLSAPAQAGLVRAVRAALGPVHVWNPPASTRCCGQPMWRWGAKAAFNAHAARLASSIGPHVRTLVVDDPGCAYTLGTLYPYAAVDLPPVRSATSLLEEAPLLAVPKDCAPHDACFARGWLREPGLRTRVQAPWLAGSILEREAGCCGGMLLPHFDGDTAARVARAHVDDLLGGGASHIVSASPTCSRRMRAVGAPVTDLWSLVPP